MSESKDCRNDCASRLQFPRRPGTDFFVGDGESCSCCDTSERTSADNRAALPRFNYRIGTYASIREFLFDRINQTANLQSWTHREPDDPAIALLEGAAILGDILTFYQETYANEAFLRTAQWRESIADLVRPLGYRLSPAIGGGATFAFEIKKTEAVVVPANFPVKATLEETGKPAEFETKEQITAYPWLSRFNLFKPLVEKKIEDTTTEFYISAPNQFASAIEIKAGDRLMIGESDAEDLNQPGRLRGAEIVIVDSIREQHGTKIFKIKGNLKRTKKVSSLVAYKLGRVFHHFGYNSPTEFVKPQEEFTSNSTVDGTTTTTTTAIEIKDVPDTRRIDEKNQSEIVKPDLKKEQFPLDAEVADFPNTVPLIIQASFTKFKSSKANFFEDNSNSFGIYQLGEDLSSAQMLDSADSVPGNTFEYNSVFQKSAKSKKASVVYKEAILVRTVSQLKPAFVKWGAMSATVSLLTLSESLASSVGDLNLMNIRDAQFHETVSALFVVKRAKPETDETSGNDLNFYGTAAQVGDLKDRRIMFEKPGAEPQILSVTNVPSDFDETVADYPQLYPISVSDTVDYADFPNEKPAVTVYGNLVEANEGKTQPETVIGSGDNTKIFQTFKLPKSVLTYHLNAANTPPETPEVEIYVGGRLWQQVETLFERGADEQVYIVREDDAENSWTQFGDGKTGAKLPTGIKNVTAIQRVGAGAFGALKDGTTVQAGAKLKNLDKIQMPLVATGGAERESGDNAKRNAPAKIQSLGRLVSLHDYEAEVAQTAGVASVAAAWQLIENIPAVVLTVLTETGRSGEIAAIEELLNSYNCERGANAHPVFAIAGKRLYVRVAVQYALDATYRADVTEPEIRRALGVNYGLATNKEDASGLFSLQQRRFGKREYASSIEGAIQNVAGVIWAKATAFYALPDSDEPESITVSEAENLNSIVVCGSEHILSLYDAHLTLTQVSTEGN